MAFIKEKDRERLIKKVNQSYAFRKIWISITLAALLGFVIVVCLIVAGKITTKTVDEKDKLTGFGWGMVIYAALVLLFGIVALILTFTIKSPKQVQQGITKLDRSAISGKKLQDYDSAASVARDRRTSKVDKIVDKYTK